jgi:hypothetical protein
MSSNEQQTLSVVDWLILWDTFGAEISTICKGKVCNSAIASRWAMML